MKLMAQASWRRGERLALVELPTPDPKRGEVRVAVKAIGVNPVDWKMRSMGPLRMAARVLAPPPPVVVGVDFAGVVDAVGTDVTDVKVGDAVLGGTDFSRGQRGSYADTVFVQPDQLAVLPAGFDIEIAGALPVVGVTAWMSIVEVGGVQSGERVLVLGASGGVGQLCVQIAKRIRGATVVGVCSQKNAALVQGLGADHVIDYGAGDPLDAARAHGPYRAVVDCVGGYPGGKCRALLAPGGRHVVVSGDGPAAMVDFIVAPFTSKMILGKPTRARLTHIVDAIASGAVALTIAKRFPLAEAEAAHALSQEGRMTGKIILLP
jgi:NADPH2:quinone reductase